MYNTNKPGNALLIDEAKRTWRSNYVTVFEDGCFRRNFHLPVSEIDHTDGIGSKGIYHWQCRTFRNAVLDALAMNLNDLLMVRAKPYKLQNHIFLPEEDLDAVKNIATALADECCARNIAITGGECAIHDDHRGMEISITMSGFIDKHYVNRFQKGDILIGLASSGLHSNGFTYLRKLFRENGLQFRDEWLTPTRIYTLPDAPNGSQHITGGAFSKIKKRLHGVDAIIHRNHKLVPQEVFKEIYCICRHDLQMYKTFNCGIGMVLSVLPEDASQTISKIGGEIIGEVKEGNGSVLIDSMFSNVTVML